MAMRVRTGSVAVWWALVLVLVGAVAGAAAGPLDPPVGPVAPTGKTLVDTEPRTAVNSTNTPGSATSVFVISQPGSYYLTANVAGQSGKNGVEITTSNVTLDLKGFTVAGVAGSLDGVRVSAIDRQAVTVRNGTVSRWGGDGVDFNSTNLCTAESLMVSENGGAGIFAGFGTHVTECAVYSNGGDGIVGGDSSVIRSCTAVFNSGAGIKAVFGEAIITNCVAQINGTGIQVVNNCTVTGNQCCANFGSGILATADNNRIEGNNVNNGTIGIQVTGSGNIIVRNSVADALTAYSIASNNRYGPIVSIAAPGTPSVSGPSAAGTLTTSDPWANFTY